MEYPVIGLTPQYDSQKNRIWMRHQYTGCITAAGGLPVLLVQYADRKDVSAAADLLDGVFFTGGPDVHPKFYGEEVLPECGEISETRDLFELALYAEAVRRDMPVFGICRGIQLINVGAGGTLHQHIPGHSDGVSHTVRIDPDSLLADILKTGSLTVNSYHHQAVKTAAPGLKASAFAENGETNLAEAVWCPEMKFNLSVQWHPEYTYEDDPYSRSLFGAFITACRAYRKSR